MELKNKELVRILFFFLSDEWGMKGLWEGGSNNDSYKEGQEVLAYHEKVRWMKVGGYNIMKQLAFQGVVKSTCVLVNGNKIFKWWLLWAMQVRGERTHEYGD
jgi:hypothetical protein